MGNKKIEKTIEILKNAKILGEGEIQNIISEFLKYLPGDMLNKIFQVYTDDKLSTLKKKLNQKK